MEIVLRNAGKRYRLDWIFREVDYIFRPGERYALLGPNGSGKSTLLKVLSGQLSPTRGQVSFVRDGQTLDPDLVYRAISYAGPYIELIEEFSLEEAIAFHSGLKPLLPGLTPEAVFDLLALPRARTKELRYFSSGMKQRVKLALAICSDTPVLLLDEPATNLDLAAIDWYKTMVERFAGERLVIIASNDPGDAAFCPIHLNILDFKPRR
jgi:ABC-type multidrug transport system ATPase subunit